MIVLTKISVLEWVIIGLALLSLGIYVAYTIYRKKHPKKKEEDDE